MLYKSVKAQILFLLRQWSVQLVFFILLSLNLLNFVDNLKGLYGYDVYNIYHPAKMLLLSMNKSYYDATSVMFFIQIYPLLIALPATLSLTTEDKHRTSVYIVSRSTPVAYKLGKWIAVFAVTTLVFALPSLLELVLNVLVFPLSADNDPLSTGLFSPTYYEIIHNYLFCDLYIISPYLYAVVSILFFGCCSGVLAVFSMSLASVFPLKFRVLYLLPPYILLAAYDSIIQKFSTDPTQHSWRQYLLLHTIYPKEIFCLLIILALLTVLSLVWTLCHRRSGYL